MTSAAAPTKKTRDFNRDEFLATVAKGRTIVSFYIKQTIFAQGAPCDGMYYIQNGRVKLMMVSNLGKETTIGILSVGGLIGEGCVARQFVRLMSATSIEDCSLMGIENGALKKVHHQEHAFSDMVVPYLLTRNIRYEEALIDQLRNSSKKRLARILLLPAKFGKEDAPEAVILKIGNETSAEMAGTTRSQVSLFMNKFRKLGLVNYDAGGLEFFGEGCITRQLLRLMSATSIEDCSLKRIEHGALKGVQHQERAFADMLLEYLLNKIFGIRKT